METIESNGGTNFKNNGTFFCLSIDFFNFLLKSFKINWEFVFKGNKCKKKKRKKIENGDTQSEWRKQQKKNKNCSRRQRGGWKPVNESFDIIFILYLSKLCLNPSFEALQVWQITGWKIVFLQNLRQSFWQKLSTSSFFFFQTLRLFSFSVRFIVFFIIYVFAGFFPWRFFS